MAPLSRGGIAYDRATQSRSHRRAGSRGSDGAVQGHAGSGSLRTAATARARRDRRVRSLPNTKIELLEPLGEGSPIASFLQRSPAGGIHHICYEVADILKARDRLKASGARVLGDGEPRIGAHGKPVLFLHPKDFNGALVELEQA